MCSEANKICFSLRLCYRNFSTGILGEGHFAMMLCLCVDCQLTFLAVFTLIYLWRILGKVGGAVGELILLPR